MGVDAEKLDDDCGRKNSIVCLRDRPTPSVVYTHTRTSTRAHTHARSLINMKEDPVP